ncbi:ATPase H(+)-transporting accessory protein 2 [Daktulosphaira vitifoliae]|uniref:ATPase H(+)-transporting accessory protein 2 n=1 Tax=Daktulosphaira vitifoliae TaxID=58002 RepID=UPI0021A9B692|nr:ATPase H(+)-transporting accessory protein 2 [Daktulosphaira vitifoliae]
MRIALLIALVVCAFAQAKCNVGELYTLHSPEAVRLVKDVSLRVSQLPDIFSSIFGFTIFNEKETWDSLLVSDLFGFPEAIVNIVIPGVKNADLSISEEDQHYLINDEPIDEIFYALEANIRKRYPTQETTIMQIVLSDEPVVKGTDLFKPINNINDESKIVTEHLNLLIEQDSKFLAEIYQLNALAKTIKTKVFANGVPDLYWITAPNLQNIINFYGSNSYEAGEAKKILSDALNRLSQSFSEAYKNKVLVTATTTNSNKINRSKRQANNEKLLNIASTPSSDYPVIFNLLLWFTVIFVFSLLAISLSIADMDPGRDSIIYRMTSNRMKKEN